VINFYLFRISITVLCRYFVLSR